MSPTKAEVRNAGLQRRDAVPDDERARFSARLAAVLPTLILESAPAGDPPLTSLFSPILSEPDPLPLAVALQAAGVPLALPVDWSHGMPLVYRRWEPGDRLAAGPLSIAEPLDEAEEVDPRVLIIPVVAFDRRGGRIGYGAGNVDRTLERLRVSGAVRAIGVAYAAQEVETVPMDTHDEPLDLLVTDSDVFAFAR